jgi:hypothetical protein
MVTGIRVRSKQEIERLIDRLESKAHQAAIEVAEAARLLEQQSDVCVGEVSQTRSRKCSESAAVCVHVYNRNSYSCMMCCILTSNTASAIHTVPAPYQ